MLDLDHPQSPHVFAAASQLDSVRAYLRKISCSDTKARLFMLEQTRPCFVALRWIHTQHFADKPHIAVLIDLLETEVEKLVHLGDGRIELSPVEIRPWRCPVCRIRLSDGTTFIRFFKQRSDIWCEQCLEAAFRALDRVESVEEGFGTDAI